MTVARVSTKGARRWVSGHPWIYRTDVTERPIMDAGAVLVHDNRGKPLGWALWSPLSEISLRLLDRNPDAVIDQAWWDERIASAIARRVPLEDHTNALRLVHGEADGCPSLVCDRYDEWLVVQFMSAGLERFREEILLSLRSLAEPSGILARNDVPLRGKEGLPRETVVLHGDVPREIEVHEYGVKFLAAPWTGQKTGAFLDQRENRHFVGTVARGRALDCFSYHGSFALHLAKKATHVTPLDKSGPALRHDRPRSPGFREDPGGVAWCDARVQGHQSSRDSPARSRRAAVHRELQLSSDEVALSGDAAGRGLGQR